MATKLDASVAEFIERAIDARIENYEVTVHPGLPAGEGLQSVITFVSLKNKKTGDDTHLVIKQVRPAEIEQMQMLAAVPFINEITYFTKILPALSEFQKSYPEVRPFDNFPKCYLTSLESAAQKLALENLTFYGYQVPPKSKPLEPKLLEMLIEMFAEYHALSFAFKENQPENFQQVAKALTNPFAAMMMMVDMMKGLITSHFVLVKKYLEEEKEDEILEKFDKYLTNVYIAAAPDDAPNGVFLHADCWSNNFLIKYNAAKEPEHIKLIDFQQGHFGPPAVDLCNLIYAGAGKESLDKLEDLLKHYHKHLTETLKKYGCDAGKIYPFETLKKEWKEKSKFGLTVGLMIWKIRLAMEFNLPDVGELFNATTDGAPDLVLAVKFSETEYKKIALDLVRHMHENDFL